MPLPPSPQSIIVSVIDSKPTKSKFESKSIRIVTWWRQQWRAVLAELIATLFLVLFGCMTCLPISGFEAPPLLYTSLGFGLIIFVNVQIFGHISGAHMNPFVSVIAVIYGRVSIATGIVFIIAQCIGSTLGYGILIKISHHNVIEKGICLTLPQADLSSYQAVCIEMILTMMLSLMICAFWDPVNESKQDSTALKFGFAIVALCTAGVPLTGCSMNPARSLGPALWSERWESQWVYWVGPLVGGIIPAVFYKYVWLTKPKNKNSVPHNTEIEQKSEEDKP